MKNSLLPAAVFGLLLGVWAFLPAAGCNEKKSEESVMSDKNTPAGSNMPPLSEDEKRVIQGKGTERPFTGRYWNYTADGLYRCRQCGAPLYKSADKFASDCGWPSFDQEIPGAIKRVPDADGRRTEIVCAKCSAHLGHVFEGEGLTPKNVRHCVNSASLSFLAAGEIPATTQTTQTRPATEEAIFAGGCFWGVEHHFQQTPGVISAVSGYTGGSVPNPTYKQVCTGLTGHAEAVLVTYDPSKVSYEKLARLFFEIHDPTTLDSQGPDFGTQYRSAIFYKSDDQKKTALKLIDQLKAKGYDVVTQVLPAKEFYAAEDYHQDYLDKHPERPSCHIPVKRFDLPK